MAERVGALNNDDINIYRLVGHNIIYIFSFLFFSDDKWQWSRIIYCIIKNSSSYLGLIVAAA